MIRVTPLEGHRVWAPTYDTDPNPLLALEARITAPLFPKELAGLTVVDVAGGTGRWARFAIDRGARAYGFDLCEDMLRGGRGIRIVSDANRLPVRDAVADMTVCAFGFSYTGICLDELARITKQGGMVIATDMHPDAVTRGWKRSFNGGQSTYEIASVPYALSAVKHSSLDQICLLEAAFGPEEEQAFVRAGRPDLYEKVAGIPAVFAAKWLRR